MHFPNETFSPAFSLVQGVITNLLNNFNLLRAALCDSVWRHTGPVILADTTLAKEVTVVTQSPNPMAVRVT
jgi:hypothetical protein